MRNAAAHFDDDFDIVEPKRKKPSRRAPAGKRGKKSQRFGVSIDMTKVARYAAIGMSATVAVGIMVNALMMQKGRHPAPLFGKSIPLGEPSTPVPPHAPARKVEAAQPKTAPAAEPKEAAPLAKPVQAIESHEGAPRPDPIAKLLQGGGPPPAEKADGKKADSKTVLNAQRALVKLGFVLKPNGNLGPQTKKAIEMFEKERHLPVKGELSRRVLKIIAAESGLKIEH